jgi:hypothetical protein
MRNYMISTPHPLLCEKNGMGGACSSDGGGENRVQGFGVET